MYRLSSLRSESEKVEWIIEEGELFCNQVVCLRWKVVLRNYSHGRGEVER